MEILILLLPLVLLWFFLIRPQQRRMRERNAMVAQLKVGDELRLSRPFGRKQMVTVLALADRHMPKAEARQLYLDTTPPLSEDEREMRRIERIYRAGMQRTHAPDKRERRALRKLKGR